MPGSFEFEMRGLNELTKDLEDLVKEYPDQTEKEVYRAGWPVYEGCK